MKLRELINERKIKSDIFTFDTNMPYGLPNNVADYYVKRQDGKIGTFRWDDFENLLKNNVGVKFGTYANSSRISIFQMLSNGKILRFSEVYVR